MYISSVRDIYEHNGGNFSLFLFENFFNASKIIAPITSIVFFKYEYKFSFLGLKDIFISLISFSWKYFIVGRL